MKYLSLDIETTGLTPGNCQILEIGAVIADTNDNTTPVDQLPYIEFYIDHPIARGEWYALWMNAAIIERIAKKIVGYDYVKPEWAAVKFNNFILTHFPGANDPKPEKIVLAGKNLANFDLRFLRLLPDWNDMLFRYRVLDPMTYYWDQEKDIAPPETKTCCERAGIEVGKLHNAVNDARLVVELLRRGPQYAARQVIYPNS